MSTTVAMALASARRLPALARDAEVIGNRILRVYDRLGFSHVDQDGRVWGVTFSRAMLWGDEMVSFTIDSEALYHTAASELAAPKVIDHVADALEMPISVMRRPLTLVVDLKPKPAAPRLPARADLNLDARPADDPMAAPVGQGREGTIWRPLQEIGHALIVGTSGSGKSTFIHSALAALLTSTSPDQLQVVLVDLKRSELAPWAKAPHVAGVACTPEEAAQVLSNVVAEVDRRGELFAGIGARDIAGYNKRTSDLALPYILCVVDEALDLVLTSDKRLAQSLKTIASRGRSAGVVLWCATQHAAAVSGLPRVMNVNLTTRLVFRVADRSAAEAAGCPGAERIERDRPGRLLMKLDSAPVELQGFYLSDDKLAAISRCLDQSRGQGPTLTVGEKALVQYAVERLGGEFVVNTLGRVGLDGWTPWTVRKLAEQWERKGWLTAPAHRADARRVTPELAALAGV